MDFLTFALQDKLKSEPLFNLEGNDYFTKLYGEIAKASDAWVINSANLLNVNHWNLSALKSQRTLFNDKYETYIRKPRINLFLNVNQKGNLTLEWEPSEHGPKHQMFSDFKTFHNGRKKDWSNPWNRIFIIRDYVPLISMALHEKDSNYNRYLVEAIIELIHIIESSLKVSLEITLINQLVIEYDDPKNYLSNNPVHISIESTEDIEKARLKIKAKEWENEKLIQGLGLTAQDFGGLFIENQRDIPLTVKSLKNTIKTNTILSKDKIKGYLNKLSELFPDEFGNIMNTENISTNVIELHPKNNNLIPE